MVDTFKELDVWKVSMDLAVGVSEVVRGFSREFRWLADQIMRSAESIPSNIAEGFERQLDGDFVRFLRIAKGSASETESHLIYAQRQHLISEQVLQQYTGDCIRIKKMLNSLITHLLNRRTSSNTAKS